MVYIVLRLENPFPKVQCTGFLATRGNSHLHGLVLGFNKSLRGQALRLLLVGAEFEDDDQE